MNTWYWSLIVNALWFAAGGVWGWTDGNRRYTQRLADEYEEHMNQLDNDNIPGFLCPTCLETIRTKNEHLACRKCNGTSVLAAKD